jgi:hypothetical protein
MKSTLLFLAAASAVFPAIAGESPIPSSFPPERYETMIAKSPFALATPPAPVVDAPPEKNFADGWFVSGLAQLDGKDFVTIKSRDLGVQFSLFGSDPKDGVTLQKVEWSPAIGKSTVTIAKDGQTAKLEFNQAELQSTAAAPAMPAAMPPGAIRPPGVNNGAIRPAIPRPSQPIVQPQQYGGLQNAIVPGRGGVPQPQQYGGVPNANNRTVQPNGLPQPQVPDNRRRIRVINNAPAQ